MIFKFKYLQSVYGGIPCGVRKNRSCGSCRALQVTGFLLLKINYNFDTELNRSLPKFL